MARNIVIFVICSGGTWMYILQFLEYSINLRSCWLMVLSSAVLLISYLVLSIIERGVLKSSTVLVVDLSVSLFSYQIVLHIFCSFIVWCLYFYDCYVLLVIDPLLLYNVPVSVVFFVLKSALSNTDIATPAFFWLMFVW